MMLKKNLFELLARFFLGSIFLLSGFLKLTGPIENFRGMIVAYGVIPYAWVGTIAVLVPWLELLSAVCLILGYFPRVAAASLGALSFSFLLLIGVAHFHGTLPANCGCFGDGIHISPYQMLFLDALNVFLAFQLARIKNHVACISG